MSTPPNKLRTKLSAMKAARDATDTGQVQLPKTKRQPIDEYEIRYGGNRSSSNSGGDSFIQDAISSDSRLQDDLDTANRNLTGFTKKAKK